MQFRKRGAKRKLRSHLRRRRAGCEQLESRKLLANLAGNVFNDTGRDGSPIGDPGFPGVDVALFDQRTNTQVAVTRPDSQGNYLFANQPAGLYRVELRLLAGQEQTFPVADRFSKSQFIQTSVLAGSVDTADFDQDGFIDLAVGNEVDRPRQGLSGSVTLLGNGGGGDTPFTGGRVGKIPLADGFRAQSVHATDLTGNGREDLLVTSFGAPSGPNDDINGVFAFANNGGISLSATSSPMLKCPGGCDGVLDASLADVTGDGLPELVAIGQRSQTLAIFGNGSRTDIGPDGFADKPVSLATGTLNADTTADVVVAHFNDQLTILLSGSSSPTVLELGSKLSSVEVADVDRDGNDDILALDWGSALGTDARLHVLYGNGMGAFSSPTTIALPPASVGQSLVYPSGLDVQELPSTSSSFPEILIANEGGSFFLIENAGRASLTVGGQFPVSFSPSEVTKADSSLPDLASTSNLTPMEAKFADVTGDGVPEAIVSTKIGGVAIYADQLEHYVVRVDDINDDQSGLDFGVVGGRIVSGVKFIDFDRDEIVDAGEEQAGVTIYADTNGNDIFDFGEPSDVTDSSGAYQIVLQSAATVSIREDVPTGFLQVFPAGGEHSIPAGSTSLFTDRNFGNVRVDFGDAPDSYQTLLASDGPRHGILPGLSLGSMLDPEPDAQPLLDGTGDDLNGAVIVPPSPVFAGAPAPVSAGDAIGLVPNHNYWNRYDVNDDFRVTARDALNVLNYMGRGGEAEDVDSNAKMFYDVNADRRVSAADALSVINAMGRGEGDADDLIELLITARDLNDQVLPLDNNGEINVEVGQIFDIEISYDDLRLFNDRLGAFQLFTDIPFSQSGVVSPVLNETQRLIIDEAIMSVPTTGVTFTIPQSPPGITGALTYTSPFNSFANDPASEVAQALTTFGYSSSQFTISTLDFGNDDLGFQIHFEGNEFGNVDLPNISVDVNESNPADTVATETFEFAPFLADGVTPNSDAVRFNLNTVSRTFNDGQPFYTAQNRGQFDANGFTGVGGLGMVPLAGGGIPQLANGGNFIEPFDAYSLRVFINQPVTDLIIGVNPGEDPEATLLYGRDEPVPQDFVLTDTTVDTSATQSGAVSQNGIANLTINATTATPAGTFSLAPTNLTVGEGDGNATLTVTRTGGSSGAVAVSFATADGSAFAGADYTSTSGTLNFADGETSMTITVPITDDTAMESNESFTVTLSNPTGGAGLGSPSSTVTIQDNDTVTMNPGVFTISPVTTSVSEGSPTISLSVNRSGGSDGAVSVDFATADQTAMAGFDYTATAGTLNFAAGETSQTITIPIIDDNINDPNETFTVSLSSPTGGATLGVSTLSTITINDNDGGSPVANDEDGVVPTSPLVQGNTATFNVTATNLTAANAFLQGFIDLDGNGSFGAGEQFVTDLVIPAGTNAGVFPVSVSIPDDAVTGTTFARFRVSQTSGLGPAGAASTGEVEDYAFTILQSFDFGDAPDTFGTTLPGGARHGISSSLRIGVAVDSEPDGQPTPQADGDDLDIDGDDEDGVRLAAPLRPGGTGSFELTATNTTGSSAFIHGFIDLDGDNTFNGTGEQFVSGQIVPDSTVNGVFVIPVAIPSTATLGDTVVRFRLSPNATLGPTGDGGIGEVEDHTFAIEDVALAVDDAFSVSQDTIRDLDVLANDIPSSFTPLTIVGASQGQNGTTTIAT